MPTPQTKVDIISNALDFLGQGPVTAVNMNAFTQVADDVYTVMVETALSSDNWRFATKLSPLNRLPNKPLTDRFQYIFQLPADYLALWGTWPRFGDFEIYNGNKLYANAPNLTIEYRFRPDETLFPPYFCEYLSFKLASYLAGSVARDLELAQLLGAKADDSKQVALFTDAQSRPGVGLVMNGFTDIRY